MSNLDGALFDAGAYTTNPIALADRFGTPPFSVLDADSHAWQERKRLWLSLGIRSEVGRDEGLTYGAFKEGDAVNLNDRRTSVFDPVLCEMAYRWWCPPGGRILDPFAGGSVRGVVAAMTGRHYTGVELRGEQVTANREQDDEMLTAGYYTTDTRPTWIEGDSTEALPPGPFDFIFSCPPYHDLEVYSDHPRDLSNVDWWEFINLYKRVIARAVDRLADNRFAAFVIGNVRGPDGTLRDLASLTVEAFGEAGADYYNDVILRTPVGTLPQRTANVRSGFEPTRKIGRRHQYVSVFIKGDWRAAVEACGPITDTDDEAPAS